MRGLDVEETRDDDFILPANRPPQKSTTTFCRQPTVRPRNGMFQQRDRSGPMDVDQEHPLGSAAVYALDDGPARKRKPAAAT